MHTKKNKVTGKIVLVSLKDKLTAHTRLVL